MKIVLQSAGRLQRCAADHQSMIQANVLGHTSPRSIFATLMSFANLHEPSMQCSTCVKRFDLASFNRCHPRCRPCRPRMHQRPTQVAAEGAKAQPQARSAPSVELPLIMASREELSAMPVKDLKKILAERGIGCARRTMPCFAAHLQYGPHLVGTTYNDYDTVPCCPGYSASTKSMS